jgi:NAD(P)-dependent dehydrogenase (short-subunit alcohol dehydrogenase family)
MPKHVIITGANGNVGMAAVKKFMEEGFHVVAVARSGENLGFAEGSHNFELHSVDLTDEDACQQFFAELISLKGTIDAALFLAGGFEAGNIESTSGSSLKKMFSINFETVFNAARPVFQQMINQNTGRMVFVGAKPALEVTRGKDAVGYALSKSLVIKFAELLNAEAKGKNVTVSVIIPGTIDTPPNRIAMPTANPADWVKPEEVADLMYFICSDKSKNIREPIYKLYNNS